MIGYTGFFYIILAIVKCEKRERPMVETNVGKIRGLKAKDGNYYMYLGIPYATVDILNPFSSAIPSLKFEGIFEASNDSRMCPHANQNDVVGTLDCLRLNIYVPDTNLVEDNVPVMVWIHGGNFKHGHGGKNIYGPKYLIQHDVIVVTFNYRLGPYGFMCLDLPEIPGNQGLKDQYLALQWIKANIEAFGGNPNQITLFGEGAGAHSVDLHLISTKELLFNKVILQSGSAQSVAVLQEPDKSAPLKIAKHIGLKSDNPKDVLNYLRHSNIESVISAANYLNIQFKPCVESLFDNVEPFLSNSWIHSPIPKVQNMPVLMGFNKHEFAKALHSKNITNYNIPAIIFDNIQHAFNLEDEEVYELTDLVTRFYIFGETNIDKVKWGLINFMSDFSYIHPVHRTLHKYLANGASKIYFYMLSYVGKRHVLTTSYDENGSTTRLCCASHGSDLVYLFHKQSKPELNETDYVVLKRMTTMWTNFAKYGDPTPAKCKLLPIKWEPVERNKYHYLNIDTRLSLRLRPLPARMAFWDLFFRQYKLHHPGNEED